jgi:hypothetical protein
MIRALTNIAKQLLFILITALLTFSYSGTVHANTADSFNAPIARYIQGSDVDINSSDTLVAKSDNVITQVNTLRLLRSSFGNIPIDRLDTFDASLGENTDDDFVINADVLSSNTMALDVASSDDQGANISNNITLNAKSGQATHSSGNGSAVSGNATAIANILTLIDSTISAPRSFIGNITINGKYDGDIIIPERIDESSPDEHTPETLAATQHTGSGFSTDEHTKVVLSAKGGEVAAQNTTKGKGNTNLTIYNLTGHQIVGDNCLLVFVNIMGNWTGLITTMPAGTKSAITGNSTFTSSNSLGNSRNTDIHNNIAIEATSGDAMATNSPTSQAQSGNANASLALGTVSNTTATLNNWFGVIFINVIGEWSGNVTIKDIATQLPPSSATPQDGSKPEAINTISDSTDRNSTPTAGIPAQTAPQPISRSKGQETYVLSGQHQNTTASTAASTQVREQDEPQKQKTTTLWPITGIIIFVSGIGLWVRKRYLA